MPFSFESLTNLSSWNQAGIRGIFLLFKKQLNRDQYVLEFLAIFAQKVFLICLLRAIAAIGVGSVYLVCEY